MPSSTATWVDEVIAVAAITPRPEAAPAAIAARGWQVSTGFIARIAELATDEAIRLTEVWDEPAEMPEQVTWAARYLAGQVHLDHMQPSEAVAIMAELVRRWGGTPVPVMLPDPEDADARRVWTP